MMGDFKYRTHTQFFNEISAALGGDDKAEEFEYQWRLNYVDEKAISDLKELGFNSVRVPFNFKLFYKNDMIVDDGFEFFDRVISFCRTRGMYVLLDMHGAPGECIFNPFILHHVQFSGTLIIFHKSFCNHFKILQATKIQAIMLITWTPMPTNPGTLSNSGMVTMLPWRPPSGNILPAVMSMSPSCGDTISSMSRSLNQDESTSFCLR